VRRADRPHARLERVRDRTIGVGVAPEFMPKQNSEQIGSDGCAADNPPLSRLAICETAAALPVETSFALAQASRP
jgi:hypothetical protein